MLHLLMTAAARSVGASMFAVVPLLQNERKPEEAHAS